MKFSLAILSLTLTCGAAFAPTTRLSRSFALQASVASPPTREAPGAGWEPEWEDRPGLSPEEFIESDIDKPDLAGMWECPLTRWDSDK